MYDFLVSNWQGIVAVITAILFAADKLVALTPTKADDDFVAKVENALSVIGIKKPDDGAAK